MARADAAKQQAIEKLMGLYGSAKETNILLTNRLEQDGAQIETLIGMLDKAEEERNAFKDQLAIATDHQELLHVANTQLLASNKQLQVQAVKRTARDCLDCMDHGGNNNGNSGNSGMSGKRVRHGTRIISYHITPYA